MPKLPDASVFGARPTPQSGRGISTYRAGIAERAMYDAGQALSGAGDDIYRVHKEQEEKKNRFELARARSHFLTSSIAAESELDNDQNFDSYEKRYTERMGKVRKEAAALISDPYQRDMFDVEVDTDLARGIAQVKGKADSKRKDFGSATLFDTLKSNRDMALRATDETTRTAIIENSADLIQGAYDRGYISADNAVRQRQAFIEDYAFSRAQMLPPEEQIKLLNPGENGGITTLQNITSMAGKNNGVDGSVLFRIAMLESRGNPEAVNPVSGASGLFQFMPKTAKQYKIGNPKNASDSAEGAARLLKDNAVMLERKLGRAPTPEELYLAHQQGAGGALALLTADPNENAIEALGKVYKNKMTAAAAIVNNGGSVTMTSGEFVQKWQEKYNDPAIPTESDVAMPYFPKQGDWVDFIPPDKRMELLQRAKGDKTSQTQAALDRITQAIEGGKSPEAADMAKLGDEDLKKVRRYYEYQNGFRALTPEEETARDVYFDQLARQYAQDPRAILEPTVLDLKMSLNPDDFEAVQKWRETAAGGNKSMAASEGEITKAADYYMDTVLKLGKGDAKGRAEFRRQFYSRAAEYERRNQRKPAGDEIYRDVGDHMVMELQFSRFGPDKHVRVMDMTGKEDLNTVVVPDNARQEIVTDWRRIQGDSARPLTDDEIRQVYLKSIGVK